MTYRERRERRAEKRRTWADKRRTRQEGAFDAADRLASAIPAGQPILVGHHSEKHARRDQDRIHSNMAKGVAHGRMAEHHDRAADTIERQLDQSIYRDDHDEVERLEAKLAALEARRTRVKAINAWLRKNRKRHMLNTMTVPRGTGPEAVKAVTALFMDCQKAMALTADERHDLLESLKWNQTVGFPPYVLQNLGGTIKRVRDRLPAARERAAQRARVREALEAER